VRVVQLDLRLEPAARVLGRHAGQVRTALRDAVREQVADGHELYALRRSQAVLRRAGATPAAAHQTDPQGVRGPPPHQRRGAGEREGGGGSRAGVDELATGDIA